MLILFAFIIIIFVRLARTVFTFYRRSDFFTFFFLSRPGRIDNREISRISNVWRVCAVHTFREEGDEKPIWATILFDLPSPGDGRKMRFRIVRTRLGRFWFYSVRIKFTEKISKRFFEWRRNKTHRVGAFRNIVLQSYGNECRVMVLWRRFEMEHEILYNIILRQQFTPCF